MHTRAKIHILSVNSCSKKSHFLQNSHLKNLILTIITIYKSHFWQNLHFWNLIFHKIHIFETSKSREFLYKKLVFALVLVWNIIFEKFLTLSTTPRMMVFISGIPDPMAWGATRWTKPAEKSTKKMGKTHQAKNCTTIWWFCSLTILYNIIREAPHWAIP